MAVRLILTFCCSNKKAANKMHSSKCPDVGRICLLHNGSSPGYEDDVCRKVLQIWVLNGKISLQIMSAWTLPSGAWYRPLCPVKLLRVPALLYQAASSQVARHPGQEQRFGAVLPRMTMERPAQMSLCLWMWHACASMIMCAHACWDTVHKPCCNFSTAPGCAAFEGSNRLPLQWLQTPVPAWVSIGKTGFPKGSSGVC